MQVGVLRHPLEFGDAAHVCRIGADDVDGTLLDEFDKVLPQVDLLTCVNVRRRAARDLAVQIGEHVRRVVAGDHVLQPHHVEGLAGPGQLDRIGNNHARATVEGQANSGPTDRAHRLDAGHHVGKSLARQQAAIRVEATGLRLAVGKPVDATGHAAVEGDALLDEAEVLRRLDHPLHVVGMGLRVDATLHGEAHVAVVDTDAVAHLAAEQPVHGHTRRLAGDIPQGHLDGTDGGPPGLEGTHATDPRHDALHVPRICFS